MLKLWGRKKIDIAQKKMCAMSVKSVMEWKSIYGGKKVNRI